MKTLYLVIFLILVISCSKDDSKIAVGNIKTLGIERIGYTSAICKFFSGKQKDSTIAENGVCWNTSGNPTIEDDHVASDYYFSNLDVYKALLYELADNTTYYVRAYAKDSMGIIGYGEIMKFTTLAKIPVNILFQMYYWNNAWGEIQKGFFIGDDGYIRGYDMWDRSDVFIVPDNSFPANIAYYTKEDLDFNYYLTDTCYGKVNLDTLNKLKELIPELLNSGVTYDNRGANDYGFGCFYAYYWDAENDRYQRIFLKVFGDECYSNKEEKALKISDWLFKTMKVNYYNIPQDSPDSLFCPCYNNH
jgi:hypothetical protein